MVSEKELLIGIFNAIGALAKRLTGDTLVVALKHDNGGFAWTYPDVRLVKWYKSDHLWEASSIQDITNPAEFEYPHVPKTEFGHTLGESRNEPNATETKPDQALQELANRKH